MAESGSGNIAPVTPVAPTDPGSLAGDRRPIAARGLPAFQRIAAALAAKGVSPNAISVVGMLCCIVAGVLLALTPELSPGGQRAVWLAAAVLVQLRLQANLLDGMVAIQSGRASPVGQLYNEVPDRVSDAATFIGMGYAVASSPVLGYVATIVAVFTAYVRVQGKVAGAPQDFCGPMAKPHRMFVVTVAALYCGLTPAAWQPTWRGWGVPALALLVIAAGGLLTAGRRLVRMARALQAAAVTTATSMESVSAPTAPAGGNAP